MKREKLERMKNRVYAKSVTGFENMTCTDWKRLFSEKELQALDRFYQGKVSCHFYGYAYELKKRTWTEKYQEAEQIWNRTFQQDEKDEGISCPHFPVFYQRLFQFAHNLLLASTDGLEKDTVTLLWKSLLPDLENQYVSCSLRVLIQEMHRLKVLGLLTASDPKKEYARFEQEYVNQFPYFLDLFDRYPVMWGLVVEKTVHFINSRLEAWKNHEKDRDQIAEKLGIEKGMKLISIQGGQSDFHRSGQSVLTFLYENGMQVLYKPRSLKNEQLFQKILHWFSSGTGISQRCYQIIDRTTYGWEEWIPSEECQGEGAVKAFYKRTGQLLFLAYLFSINDLHQENLLAAGEFPIIVDLETFLQSRKSRPKADAGGQAENRILNSVLATGILPFYTGDDDGNAAILSALGDAAPQRSWVKVPVIEKPGTSAMHIGYRHIPIRQAENVPTLNGIRKGAAAYKDFIIQGFDRTYQFAVSHLNELFLSVKD